MKKKKKVIEKDIDKAIENFIDIFRKMVYEFGKDLEKSVKDNKNQIN